MVVLFVLHVETDESSAQTIISGQCGPDAKYVLYSDGMLQITGSGEMYQYDSTPAPWYDYRDDINSVFICVNITKLGASAFKDCTHLTHLTIPIALNSVTSDKYPAFEGCSSIYRINLTCGHGSDGEYGYYYAASQGLDSWYRNTPWYQSRDVLKVIFFENGIKAIGSDAFCELNITSIVLPDSVVHLGNHCFFNCTKLTDLTIPISLNSYGSDTTYPAFQGCMAVQKVTFTKGNGVPFDYYVWWTNPYNAELAPWNLNSDIAKTIIIEDDVTRLGGCMFRGCNIKELTIPVSIDLYTGEQTPFQQYNTSKKSYPTLEKVTLTKGSGRGCDYDIDMYSVDDATSCPWNNALNIKSITIEEGVTHLGSYTFDRSHIEDLVIQNADTSFGQNAFYKCTIKNLTIPISLNAVWLDDDPTWHSSEPAFYNVSGIEKIDFTPGSGYGFDYAPCRGSNCWYSLTPWYQCRDTINEINFAEGITHIGSDAFRELHVRSLVIPNSLESLGSHAFYNMKELSSLTIPITLDSVGSTKYPAFDQDNNIVELRYTAGTNGVGYDYSDAVPFWNYSQNNGFTITFDKGIDYIGTNTFTTYKFADTNGQLEPTAANLSGHTFRGADSEWLYLVERSQD